jgi:hypothetical protein
VPFAKGRNKTSDRKQGIAGRSPRILRWLCQHGIEAVRPLRMTANGKTVSSVCRGLELAPRLSVIARTDLPLGHVVPALGGQLAP